MARSANREFTTSSLYRLIISAEKIVLKLELYGGMEICCTIQVENFHISLTQWSDYDTWPDAKKRDALWDKVCDVRVMSYRNISLSVFGMLKCARGMEINSLLLGADSVQTAWEGSSKLYCQATGQQKSTWTSLFMSVLWSLWRQRNDAIFRSVK